MFRLTRREQQKSEIEPQISQPMALIEGLEEYAGLDLSGAKRISPEKIVALHVQTDLLRAEIESRFGRYLNQDQRDWLNKVKENTVILTNKEFDGLKDNLRWKSISKSLEDASRWKQVKAKAVWFTTRMVKRATRIRGVKEDAIMTRAHGYKTEENMKPPVIFVRESGRVIEDDTAGMETIMGEEMMHGLSNLPVALYKANNGEALKNKKVAKIVHNIEEHAAPYYSYQLLDKSRKFTQRKHEGKKFFWKLIEEQYGVNEAAKLYFTGESEVIDSTEVLHFAKEKNVKYPGRLKCQFLYPTFGERAAHQVREAVDNLHQPKKRQRMPMAV